MISLFCKTIQFHETASTMAHEIEELKSMFPDRVLKYLQNKLSSFSLRNLSSFCQHKVKKHAKFHNANRDKLLKVSLLESCRHKYLSRDLGE